LNLKGTNMTHILQTTGVDLAAIGDDIRIRLITPDANYDVPLPASNAAALGAALTEFCQDVAAL
jgi:hypothetical protein